MEGQLEKGEGSMEIDPSALKNILRLLNFYLSNSNYAEQQGTKCPNFGSRTKWKRKLLHAMAQRKLQNSKEAAIGSKGLRDNIALYLGEGPIRKKYVRMMGGKQSKNSTGIYEDHWRQAGNETSPYVLWWINFPHLLLKVPDFKTSRILGCDISGTHVIAVCNLLLSTQWLHDWKIKTLLWFFFCKSPNVSAKTSAFIRGKWQGNQS